MAGETCRRGDLMERLSQISEQLTRALKTTLRYVLARALPSSVSKQLGKIESAELGFSRQVAQPDGRIQPRFYQFAHSAQYRPRQFGSQHARRHCFDRKLPGQVNGQSGPELLAIQWTYGCAGCDVPDQQSANARDMRIAQTVPGLQFDKAAITMFPAEFGHQSGRYRQ